MRLPKPNSPEAADMVEILENKDSPIWLSNATKEYFEELRLLMTAVIKRQEERDTFEKVWEATANSLSPLIDEQAILKMLLMQEYAKPVVPATPRKPKAENEKDLTAYWEAVTRILQENGWTPPADTDGNVLEDAVQVTRDAIKRTTNTLLHNERANLNAEWKESFNTTRSDEKIMNLVKAITSVMRARATFVSPLDGKFHDQDRILPKQPDEHDQAELGPDVVG